MNNNKFKVGDEVLYDNRYKVKVFGISDKKDYYDESYAINWILYGDSFNIVVAEYTLSELKKKDGLEAGDVCKRKNGDRLKILCRANDEYFNEITYFVKIIEGDFKGFIGVLLAKAIEEIIYE